ncbi:hypothetical protein JXB28_01535 [Candidatus Woesearchaeota archaeon]|nr:hypothetical protein [Candidatus Woesearchaeota archaeon]
MNAKQDEITDFQDEEEMFPDSDNQRAVIDGEKQFPFQPGESLLPYQPRGKRGIEGASVDASKLSLEDRLRLGVGEPFFKSLNMEPCEGYISHKGFLAYRNAYGGIFFFEKKELMQGKQEYLLRLYVSNK